MRSIIRSFLPAVSVFISVTLAVFGCQEQPLSSLDRAKRAVQAASDSGAVQYAESHYRQAEKLLKDGRLEIAHQNGRLAPLRDYRMADSLLALAYVTAGKATEEAKYRVDSLRSYATANHEALRTELGSWRQALDGSLKMYSAERYWSAAEMAVNMADKLIRKAEFAEAILTVSKGRRTLLELGQVLAEYDNDAAQKIKIWRRWVQETIDESRRDKNTVLIVDKSDHKLYIVEAGRLTHTYPCELGYNSARQKFFSGDGATPEGKYRVTVVKNHGSKFYKALLINYPNDNDRKRFAQNKARGIISQNARIGGLIEIHGEGGSNQDWTDGCVALTNANMDHLMPHVRVGTPVTIVRRSDRWP